MGKRMIFRPTLLSGAYVIEEKPRYDERGFFSRMFCAETFRQMGLVDRFVQTNHSQSLKRGTIRGLHYQHPPQAEVKLLRCIRGSVQDVMIDLRHGSATFLKWHSEILTSSNFISVYVPRGFAHGYQALEDGSEVIYDASDQYSSELEGRVRFDDPRVGIRWEEPDIIVSPKDAASPYLSEYFTGVKV